MSFQLAMECLRCGTCCTAPDITTMDKPVGVRCAHLEGGAHGDTPLRCAIYEERPAVCRDYRPDDICRKIAAPTLLERVERYLNLFGI